MGVHSRSGVPTASNQFGLAISTTAVSLTVPGVANVAEIYVRSASVVFKRDTGTPTTTEGFQANIDDIILLQSRSEVVGFRAVREGAVDASLDVEYFTDISS